MDLAEGDGGGGGDFVGGDEDVWAIVFVQGVDVVHPTTSDDGPFELEIAEFRKQRSGNGSERGAEGGVDVLEESTREAVLCGR